MFYANKKLQKITIVLPILIFMSIFKYYKYISFTSILSNTMKNPYVSMSKPILRHPSIEKRTRGMKNPHRLRLFQN